MLICLIFLLYYSEAVILHCDRPKEIYRIVEPLNIEFPGKGDYGNNLHCNWTFKSDGPLRLTFSEMDLEPARVGPGCLDYVFAVGRQECDKFYDEFISNEEMTLEFISDSSFTNKGFKGTLERLCPWVSLACDRSDSLDPDPHSLLIYTFELDGLDSNHNLLDESGTMDLEKSYIDLDYTLELVLFNETEGRTGCYNCEAGQEGVLGCHPDLPITCGWNHNFVLANHPLSRGKVFQVWERISKLETVKVLNKERVCVGLEFLANEGTNADVVLSARGTRQEENCCEEEVLVSKVIRGSGQWDAVRLYATVRTSLEDLGYNLRLEINNVEESSIFVGKIYECEEGYRRVELVRGIGTQPRSMGGQRLKLKKECSYRGSLIDSGCVCLPGFHGVGCGSSCPLGRLGPDCTLPRPPPATVVCTRGHGCSCPPGYTGRFCTLPCSPSNFGPSCRFTCGSCLGHCLPTDGTCVGGCLPGYRPPLCLAKYPSISLPPQIDSYSNHALIKFSFNASLEDIVKYYQIEYKQQEEEDWWKESPVVITPGLKLIYNLTSLEPETNYTVRVILLDSNEEGYRGNEIPVANFTTECMESEELIVEDIEATHNSLLVRWVPKGGIVEGNCREEKVLVEFKEETAQDWEEHLVLGDFFNITSLEPSHTYFIRVSLLSGGWVARVVGRTLDGAGGKVEDLRATLVGEDSVRLEWKGIGGSGRFGLNWECVKILTSPEAQCPPSDSGYMNRNSTRALLRGLFPFRRYSVRVSELPDVSDYSQILVTTEPGLPKEAPELENVTTIGKRVMIIWKKPTCILCNGKLVSYQYKLLDSLGVRLGFGTTQENQIELQDLEIGHKYNLSIFIRNTVGWNQYHSLDLVLEPKCTVEDVERYENVELRQRGEGSSLNFSYSREGSTEGEPCSSGNEKFCLHVTGFKENENYELSACDSKGNVGGIEHP